MLKEFYLLYHMFRNDNSDAECSSTMEYQHDESASLSPDVLDEFLNVWLRNTEACSIRDLEAGVQWARRLQYDKHIGERLRKGSRNERKRGRHDMVSSMNQDELRTDQSIHSSSVIQSMHIQKFGIPLSRKNSTSLVDRSKKVEEILKDIERTVLHFPKTSCDLDSGGEQPTLLQTGSAQLKVQRDETHRVSIASAGNVSSCCSCLDGKLSAAEDASRSQFSGPDKLHRFESRLVANVICPSWDHDPKIVGKSIASKL